MLTGPVAARRIGFVRTIGSLALLAASLTAQADIANGLAVFEKTVDLTFYNFQFPGTDYAWTDSAILQSGYLSSAANHGPLDFKLFPASLTESTTSTGDTENSKNSVAYGANSGIPSVLWIKEGTKSDSQASSGTPQFHEAHSFASTTVLHSFSVSRKTDQGVVASPEFKVELLSQDRAVHLLAHKEGNAVAYASVKVSLVGTVKNSNLTGAPVEDLDPYVFINKVIISEDEWYSSLVSEVKFLKLPDWTRLGGAKFELALGLRLEMWTHAEVVPEPNGAAALVSAGLLFLTRRRTKKQG